MTFYKKLDTLNFKKMFNEGKLREDKVEEIFGYLTAMDNQGQNYVVYLPHAERENFQEEIFGDKQSKDGRVYFK